MAATTSNLTFAVTAHSARPTLAARANRRRRISPQAGRAIEMLGHAIEYLADEYVYDGCSLTAGDPQLQAVHILMALNREIYFECPIVPSFKERWNAMLHTRLA
jgi:hypothetical protein